MEVGPAVMSSSYIEDDIHTRMNMLFYMVYSIVQAFKCNPTTQTPEGNFKMHKILGMLKPVNSAFSYIILRNEISKLVKVKENAFC